MYGLLSKFICVKGGLVWMGALPLDGAVVLGVGDVAGLDSKCQGRLGLDYYPTAGSDVGVSSAERYGLINDWKGWVGGCDSILYAWGHVSAYTKRESVVNVFALSCNETLEIVDTEVNFNSADLVIDSGRPPVSDEGSARLADFDLSGWGYYYNQVASTADIDSTQKFDNFFALLKLSPWAIYASDLTNATAVDKVVAAIRTQHGLLCVNVLDSYHRVRVNDTSYDEALIGLHVSPRTFVYSANATILPGQPRVVQDLQTIRLLQALLAITLIFSLLAWGFMPRTEVVVSSPTSIARKLALAAGGNPFEEVLPSGLEDSGTENLRHREDRRFILGWRSPDGSTGKVEKFGIWVLTPKEVEEMRERQAKESRWTLWGNGND